VLLEVIGAAAEEGVGGEWRERDWPHCHLVGVDMIIIEE